MAEELEKRLADIEAWQRLHDAWEKNDCVWQRLQELERSNKVLLHLLANTPDFAGVDLAKLTERVGELERLTQRVARKLTKHELDTWEEKPKTCGGCRCAYWSACESDLGLCSMKGSRPTWDFVETKDPACPKYEEA